jgi:3',5'-cyclic AMP phosphodiesterase CpdA
MCSLNGVRILICRPLRIQALPPPYRPSLQEGKIQDPSHSFRFAFLSDTHKGWGVFKPSIKEIAKDRYAFAVLERDIVEPLYRRAVSFLFRKLTEVRGKPLIYFVPGNHDISSNNGCSMENFLRYCSTDHFWFSWGKSAFVALNDARLTISEDRFRWLEKTLRKLRGAYTHQFVFMHIHTSILEKSRTIAFPMRRR